MSACIFCQIARGEIPADIVYQNDKVTAFRDINPKAPVHVLVIPNEHIDVKDNLKGADVAVMADVLLAAKAVAKREGVHETGFRMIINVGADAGQKVDHLHMHVLGGKRLGPMVAR